MEGSRSDREFESRARVGSSTIFFDRAILRETRTGIRGLFIPFGAVWLSQFALPVSRSPARSSRVSMPRVFSLSLPLSLGFPFRPTPAAGFRPSDSNRRRVPTIDASTARARAPRLFLLEHLAVIKRFRRRAKEKNEIETVSKLLS